MSGQGCPNFVYSICAANRTVVFVVAAALFTFILLTEFPAATKSSAQEFYSLQPMVEPATENSPSPISSASYKSDSDQSMRFRISWGGGTPQTWTGKLSVTNGELSSIAPLGLTPDATASVVQVGKDIEINHWVPTNYGGADFTLQGSSQAQVKLSLTSREQPDAKFERSISLQELLAGTVGGELDVQGNRCSISRVPGDDLQIEFERDHLVFKPGESFRFSVRPNATTLVGRSAVCRIKLVPAHGRGGLATRYFATKTLSFQLDKSGSAAPQELTLAVPDEEASYNIEVELEPNRYQASFGSKKSPHSRSLQLLVLNDRRNVNENESRRKWRRISTIDPVNIPNESFPSWSQFARMTGLQNRDSLGNELRSPVTVGQDKMMKLAPGGWQAIPVSIDRLDKPHIVELEYIADDELAIGMSLLQPDVTGQISMYGFDTGVYIPKTLSHSEDSKMVRRHRITIWPNTQTPYLLIANRHATASATIGKVNVFAGPDRIEPSSIHGSDQTALRNSNVPPRRLMAFFEAPLFPESFGARSTIDPEVAEPLDDWRMFYDGADRLIEYLKANSYRGAFVTVASDGSSIYPSRLLLPSPKHDNGTFFSSGQDPVRKDILEMLFRMFEREGLTLVPTLALSGPLPEVEVQRKRDGTSSEFDLVDLNGVKRSTEFDEQLPIYNPLNRTVQRSVRRVVAELSQRYKSHAAFDGVALICRPDTYTLLPGRQWGYDSTTVQQFIQLQPDLQSLPDQWSEIQSVLLGSHRQQWVRWRAAEMTKWYQDIAAEVKRSLPRGKLYLAPVDLYRNEETASALSPSLHSSIDFEQVMLHLGFEAQLNSGDTASSGSVVSQAPALAGNVVMLNPHRIAPDQPLSSQRVDLAVQDSTQAQKFFSSFDYAGDLFTHRISWAHFAQLQGQSPFGEQKSALLRLQQMTPSGSNNRKRFAESIKDRDARMLVDGGWMMAMGQEESVLDMMQVFGQLPDLKFNDVPRMETGSETDSEYEIDPNARSLVVRQLQVANEEFFYVVNASPWPTSVTLNLGGGTEAENLVAAITSLSRQQFEFKIAEKSQQIVATIQVPAYGLVGARAPKQISVLSFDFKYPSNVDKDLRRHVYALQSKLTKSASPSPLRAIENPNFEISGQPTLGNWDTGQQSTASVRLDNSPVSTASESANDASANTKAQMGVASLLMNNESQSPVWIRSNFFDSTETGRLSISVWLKTNDPTRQPPLRLALEGQSRGASYYRFGSVGSLSPDPNTNQLESRWKRFAVHFDDLPVDGLENVRIGFDLMGPGQVNIDNVQVFDRWFDENDAKAMTQLLASTGPLLSNPETFDRCRRLLEGYWPSFLDQFIVLEDETNQADSNAQEQAKNRSTNEPAPTSMEMSVPIQRASDQENERKVPMFRRFRNFVPQRKSTSR